MTKLSKRAGLLTAAVGVAAAGAFAVAPGVAAASPAAPATTASVWASNVNVHQGPHLGDAVIGQVGPGNVDVICQVRGDEVHYGNYSNFWWISLSGPGYVSDVFVRGGNNDEPVPGIPTC